MPLLLGLALATIGLVLVLHGSRYLRRAYRITTGDPLTPKTLSSAAKPVELVGTARPLEESVGGNRAGIETGTGTETETETDDTVLESPSQQPSQLSSQQSSQPLTQQPPRSSTQRSSQPDQDQVQNQDPETPVTPALCASVRIQRYEASQSDDRRGGRWVTIGQSEDGEYARPFVVDGPVHAKVDPTGATTEFDEWETVETTHGDPDFDTTLVGHDSGPELQALLESGESETTESTRSWRAHRSDHQRRHHPSAGSDTRYRLQYRRLEPGDDVHVFGGRIIDRPDEWGETIDIVVGGPETGDRERKREQEQYLLTTGSESAASRTQYTRGVALAGIGLVLTLTGIALPLIAALS
ncbi:hypothetical protein [Natrialba sp. SSL1]|uniref:hypothetical protein n=1 Tax=Natrialba sp. SSL1 TaxID=1869245 RepID=UPI0008F801B9|nr:hypothetical protein [Natrialba sp. SSL1]OIB56316.1 hypothetical protein BBD46_18320 [Natrialba sp. SSL1]